MISIEDLKKMATESPDSFDFKPSGILKLIGRIEQLEWELAEANKNAARWRMVEMHIGGYDGRSFSIGYFRPLNNVNLFCGSLRQHFTDSVDAAIKENQHG